MKVWMWCVAAVAVVLPLSASVQRPLIVTTQDHSLVTIDDCEHFYARTVTSFPAKAESHEQRAVALAGIDTLRVRGSEGGSVSVRGWDRPIGRVTVCKFATAMTDADARVTLRDVVVTTHNGEIVASGPKNGGSRAWWVHLIVRVPKAAALDIISSNGGIAIRNMSGRISARATNGGISLASCAGSGTLTTDNGGISLEHISGRIEAFTQNGTIALRLEDDDDTSIEARTDEANDILCRAKVCEAATATRTGSSKVLRIGAAQPTIRLTAGGAPILIEQVR